MARDWIKMRTDLYRDPKVCLIADALMAQDGALARYVDQNMQRDMMVTRNVMRNVTVGALVSVWGVLRHRGKRVGDDLLLKGCSLAIIDDVADLPGFGEALASVGWADETDDGIVFPRFFDEFNVDPSEDAKAKNAARQRRYRENHKAKSDENRDVTVTSESNVRIEKSRDISTPVTDVTGDSAAKRFDPLAWLLQNGASEQAARDWLTLRKSKKAAPTSTALVGVAREAGKAGISLDDALRICCERGWQAFNASWEWQSAKAASGRAIARDSFAGVDYGKGGRL